MRIVNFKMMGLVLLIGLFVFDTVRAEDNPAAEGFDAAGSDAKAVEIADEVMAALGGREAWDDTRFITWKFFGNRLHVWDKHTGNVRVESQDRKTKKKRTVLMNINTKVGKAWEEGVEITDAEGLKKALRGGWGAWINDSYWLVMPYKLKDSGLTLKYEGEKDDPAGNLCDVLELTFKEVGRTPQNKYHVFVDKTSKMVVHWDYWKDRTVDEPRSLGSWNNWRKFGNIMLTDDHGRRKHTDIAVFDSLPGAVFTDPSSFKIEDYQ